MAATAAAAVTATLSRLSNYCRRRHNTCMCTGWKQRDLSARSSGTKSIYRSTTKASAATTATTTLGDLSLLLNSKYLNSHLVVVVTMTSLGRISRGRRVSLENQDKSETETQPHLLLFSKSQSVRASIEVISCGVSSFSVARWAQHHGSRTTAHVFGAEAGSGVLRREAES